MSTDSSEPPGDTSAGVLSKPTASYLHSGPGHATAREHAVTSEWVCPGPCGRWRPCSCRQNNGRRHHTCKHAHAARRARSANSGHLPSRGDFSSAFLSSSASMTSSASETQPQLGASLPPPCPGLSPQEHGRVKMRLCCWTRLLTLMTPEGRGAHGRAFPTETDTLYVSPTRCAMRGAWPVHITLP